MVGASCSIFHCLSSRRNSVFAIFKAHQQWDDEGSLALLAKIVSNKTLSISYYVKYIILKITL